MRDKVPVEQIIASYHNAMAKRISTLVARLGVKKDLVIIGGLARNPGIINWLENILEVGRLAPNPEWDPTLIGAVGAALFSDSSHKRQSSET
jgi:activator of 2-hydroxyglutaryl-CoA dehydratase